MSHNTEISNAMKIHLGEIFTDLPEMPHFVDGIRRAPARHFNLTQKDTDRWSPRDLTFDHGRI